VSAVSAELPRVPQVDAGSLPHRTRKGSVDMATGNKVIQRNPDTSGTTAIAGDRTYEVLSEIRDLLHATSETLERIVNNQDETILLLGALLDLTAGNQALGSKPGEG